ncbi:hypothetical protein LIER_15736 [Lithospermum erythrorhizon]|uniref:Uncharacterized protein n=1 Tax=Lithospermum erythrorhizon TaxID=34254 RepID=A0AAV3Q4E1_LITER
MCEILANATGILPCPLATSPPWWNIPGAPRLSKGARALQALVVTLVYLEGYVFCPSFRVDELRTPNDAAGFTSAAPGTVQSILQEEFGIGNCPTPPSSGRDNEEAETFDASVITDAITEITGASREGYVEVEVVQMSKKRKRATTKKASGKAAAPTTGNEETSKKKGARVSQTLEGFRKVTVTSVVASGHLIHIHEHYRIETGVKTRIPLANETIDAPMVNPAAIKGPDGEGIYSNMLGVSQLWPSPPCFLLRQQRSDSHRSCHQPIGTLHLGDFDSFSSRLSFRGSGFVAEYVR